jgi:(p)ppGpp synthase/HD superfamily hydrolase
MTHATVLTDRFDRALLYATHVHGGQVRKETPIPYIAHLLAVSATVLEYDGSEDMAIAALLHDAVEDQGGEPRLSDIRNRFGDRVADIVRSCSDTVVNSSAGQKKEDWKTRKTRYIEHLNLVDQDTLIVSIRQGAQRTIDSSRSSKTGNRQCHLEAI